MLELWQQPTKAEIWEQGCKAAAHGLLLNKHSNRITQIGKGQRKSLSSPLVPKDYVVHTIYRLFFRGFDQRGSPVPRRKEGNTVLCHVNTGLFTDCNKSVLPVLSGVNLLQEFFLHSFLADSYRAPPTQAESSHGSRTGNKLS